VVDENSVADPVGEKTRKGGCAVVIRNTVRAAQETYDVLAQRFGTDEATLLHPRSRAAGRSGDEARRRATDYLYAVGLDESFADRIPGRLSGGQRQRVSLALALAAEPALIIADEPTTALDVIARAEILRLLSSLTSLPQAPALLLITHDLPAAAICENIAVLHDGAIIESGETRPVLTRPEHPVTAAMCEAGAEETIDGALAAAGAAA